MAYVVTLAQSVWLARAAWAVRFLSVFAGGAYAGFLLGVLVLELSPALRGGAGTPGSGSAHPIGCKKILPGAGLMRGT